MMNPVTVGAFFKLMTQEAIGGKCTDDFLQMLLDFRGDRCGAERLL
jgi:hypothetical protein